MDSASDRPQLPDARPPIEFSAFWDVELGDESRFPLAEAFGAVPRTLEVRFRAQQGTDQNWVFFGDGVRVDAYADKTADGRPIPNDVAEPRRILPIRSP